VLRTGRKDLALATLVLDAAKAGLALIAVRMLAEGHPNQNELALTAGACAFLGHCYPVWLNFKGGKGVATFFGVLLAGAWPVALFAGVTWIAVAVLFSMSSLASLAAAFAAAVTALGGVAPDDATKLFTAALAALIFWRHRANIARIRAGSEPRINQKPAGEPVGAAPAAADPEPPAPAG
jgi:glycerol-3-phosphate acyltransferase PlsY